MPLNLFKDITELSEEELHPKFKLIRDQITIAGEREIISEWVEGFTDRDNKIVKEFQTSFHSSFWEFYLYRVFVEAGFTIDFSRNRPDFIIEKPYAINVEAVVAEIKQDGRKESERTLDDILGMLEPPWSIDNYEEFINEAITRHSNSISSKRDKYTKSYSKCDWINRNTPFVIAMCSFSQVNYGKEFHYPLLALLYGYYFNPKNNGFDKVDEILKPGTSSSIPIGVFNNSDMEDVSAIIYSCTLTLGKLASLSKSQRKSTGDFSQVFVVRHDFEPPHYKVQDVSPEIPEELSDGLFVFHNPHAKNKMPYEAFKNTNAVQVTIDHGGLKFDGENLPIVSMLHVSSAMYPHQIKRQHIVEIFTKFNPDILTSLFEVLEIDLDISPKEITLKDTYSKTILIVDLTDNDADTLINKNITLNDVVTATLKNNILETGMTTIWELVSIEKKTTYRDRTPHH